MSAERSRRAALALLALLAFMLLATLNSGGYRYGASDQAFYAPAALKQINPALYPRDAELLAAQGRLTFVDNVVGVLGRTSAVTLPTMFAALYVLALTAIATGASRIGRSLYRERWTTLALLAALTLRHAITKSGTNTLEGYFHPRQLAFGIGLIAVSVFLRGAWPIAAILALCAGAIHPTTALWFCGWLAMAIAVAERRARLPLAIAGGVAALAAAWLLSSGPLAKRLVTMDREWLDTLVTKDYLFPLQWPADAWLVNLAYIPLIVWLYRRRAAAGLTVPREAGLVAGCLVLPAIFLITLPLHAMRLALAVQLQPARLFWMLDFLATVYVVWALAEGVRAAPSRAVTGAASTTARRALVTAAVIALLSTTRGLYSKLVLVPERPVAQLDIPATDWGRAMAWARATDINSGWIADPGHTWKYGSSVRVAGQRDVLVEPVKDAAVGMYERAIALEVRDRTQALGDFASLTAERSRALASRYNLDYLVTDQQLDLPLAFDAGSLRVYRLR
jgi:hypothetical protein